MPDANRVLILQEDRLVTRLPLFNRRRVTSCLLATVAIAPFTSRAAPRLAHAEKLDDASRAVIERFASLGMRNAVATYAAYPELAKAMLPYSEFLLTRSTLPARQRELLWLRAAWLTRSDYMWAQRAPAARSAGLTAVEIQRIALGPDAAGWKPFEATLLRAVDELHVDSVVSDATWAKLAAQYDDNQLIDLLYGVGEITMHADFANTLRIEIEPELVDRLPSGITYAPAARQTNARRIGRRARITPLPATGGGLGNTNAFRTFARNPPVDALRNAQGNHIRGSNSLAPINRQLVIMRTAVLNRAEYEWAAHSRGGRQVGMDDAAVARVITGPTAEGSTVPERLLLKAVDDLYRDDLIDDATCDALISEFSEQQLLDTLFTVGAFRSAAYAINSAGVQLDSNMGDFRFPPQLR
jgi:4-carboxymuconolactone decarboxylase